MTCPLRPGCNLAVRWRTKENSVFFPSGIAPPSRIHWYDHEPGSLNIYSGCGDTRRARLDARDDRHFPSFISLSTDSTVMG